MYNVSLSTMWGVGRFADMADFPEQSRALGFCAVELNHQVTPAILERLLRTHRSGAMRVSSVHDPCPNNAARMETLPKVSDLDENRRLAAVDQARRTMDLAASVGATAVVLHVGDVWQMQSGALDLRHLFRQGLRCGIEYEAALERFNSDMRACQQPYLDAVVRSLEPLTTHARNLGLTLGIENRYYVNEIPTVDQARWLFDRVDTTVAGYWHDVGHAEVHARMGFGRHLDWLTALRGCIVGVHLHDVLPATITDHQACGQGDLDLAAVAGFVPDGALRVCEFDRRNTESQVVAGLEHLAALGFFRERADCAA